MSKVTIKNMQDTTIGIPGTGAVIAPKKSETFEADQLAGLLEHAVIAALVESGKLKVDGEVPPAVVKEKAAEKPADGNGEVLSRLAELTERLEVGFAAIEAAFAGLQAQKVEGTEATSQAASGTPPASAYSIKDKGQGWFVVTADGAEVTKSLRKEAVQGFEAKSDEEKAAFVAENKAD